MTAPTPTDEELFAAYWKDQKRTNFYAHGPAQIAEGLRNVYFLGLRAEPSSTPPAIVATNDGYYRSALDRAAYALFQLKRFADMPDAAVAFCRAEHEIACGALDNAPPSSTTSPIPQAFINLVFAVGNHPDAMKDASTRTRNGADKAGPPAVATPLDEAQFIIDHPDYLPECKRVAAALLAIPSTETSPIRDALIDLVRLKDLKLWIESGTAPAERKEQYERDKEPAWEAARLALENEQPSTGGSPESETIESGPFAGLPKPPKVPAGYVLVDERSFKIINDVLTEEQKREICLKEGERFFLNRSAGRAPVNAYAVERAKYILQLLEGRQISDGSPGVICAREVLRLHAQSGAEYCGCELHHDSGRYKCLQYASNKVCKNYAIDAEEAARSASVAPLPSGTVYLIEGRPHRQCQCDPHKDTPCPRGRKRTLTTAEFTRCLLPVNDVLVAK